LSYTTLRDRIEDFSHRSDLGGVIPTFIQNAEAEFNDLLRVRRMEKAFAPTTLVDGAIPLPDDLEEWKAVWTTTGNQRTLIPATSEWVRNQHPHANPPRYFAIEGANMICHPGVGEVAGIYHSSIPPLEINEDNWLETKRPDLYLYESLRQASIYTKNKEAEQAYNALSKSIIKQMNSASVAEEMSGGPLTARLYR